MWTFPEFLLLFQKLKIKIKEEEVEEGFANIFCGQ